MTADIRIGCMGGWCSKREKCARYHVEGVVRFRSAERLCSSETFHDQWVSMDGYRPTDGVSFEVHERLRRVFGDSSAATMGAAT